MPGTLNMWSGVRDQAYFQGAAPGWANLIVGYQYAIAIMNSTDADITTGTIVVMGADADPADPCKPDVFAPLEPVQDCQPIITGVPYGPEVQITISADRPIPARGVCAFAAPCPKQFMQVAGVPAGCVAVIGVTRLRRTDFSHLGPWGVIPQPISLMAPFSMPMMLQHVAPQAQVQPQTQTQPQRRSA